MLCLLIKTSIWPLLTVWKLPGHPTGTNKYFSPRLWKKHGTNVLWTHRTFFAIFFFREFGSKCAACDECLEASDWVRYARDCVFHLNCFTCSVCGVTLSTGEEFLMRNSNLFCQIHGRLEMQHGRKRKKPEPGTRPLAYLYFYKNFQIWVSIANIEELHAGIQWVDRGSGPPGKSEVAIGCLRNTGTGHLWETNGPLASKWFSRDFRTDLYIIR